MMGRGGGAQEFRSYIRFQNQEDKQKRIKMKPLTLMHSYDLPRVTSNLSSDPTSRSEMIFPGPLLSI